MSSSENMEIALTANELRFVISSGMTLLQYVPEKSLPTYTNFTKQEIIDFSKKMRAELDRRGLDM